MAGVTATYRVNIAFGMLESIDSLLYNTAVLLDRNGQITGKYHKVQLPLSEASAGIAPGDSVPVFDTDFGRVALLICHDTSFPEPAREAALQGAELLPPSLDSERLILQLQCSPKVSMIASSWTERSVANERNGVHRLSAIGVFLWRYRTTSTPESPGGSSSYQSSP